MDLNNNLETSAIKPIKVCFTNEIEIDMQVSFDVLILIFQKF